MVTPPANRRPQYLLPRGLVEISRPHATERSLSLSRYGRHAIELLNFASIKKFSTATTRLLVSSGLELPLPLLAVAQESTVHQRVPIQLPEEQVKLLEVFAAQAGVNPDIRVARAFRFANFIAENVYPGETITFQQDNQRPINIISSF
ncbi:MAG: hypothetical protein JWN82_270 [Candidatus Saccharibacteria bacterium]|nr:hypothetical protein [Candidatus Saccharibacteria bacterium]